MIRSALAAVCLTTLLAWPAVGEQRKRQIIRDGAFACLDEEMIEDVVRVLNDADETIVRQLASMLPPGGCPYLIGGSSVYITENQSAGMVKVRLSGSPNAYWVPRTAIDSAK